MSGHNTTPQHPSNSCHDCGNTTQHTIDADGHTDGTKNTLCPTCSRQRDIGWTCDECNNPIISEEAVSEQHATHCTLHTHNVQ